MNNSFVDKNHECCLTMCFSEEEPEEGVLIEGLYIHPCCVTDCFRNEED